MHWKKVCNGPFECIRKLKQGRRPNVNCADFYASNFPRWNFRLSRQVHDTSARRYSMTFNTLRNFSIYSFQCFVTAHRNPPPHALFSAERRTTDLVNRQLGLMPIVQPHQKVNCSAMNAPTKAARTSTNQRVLGNTAQSRIKTFDRNFRALSLLIEGLFSNDTSLQIFAKFPTLNIQNPPLLSQQGVLFFQ